MSSADSDQTALFSGKNTCKIIFSMLFYAPEGTLGGILKLHRPSVRYKSCLSEANLTKLHRKIEHNEKVCRAQELGSYAQGQGHNQDRGQIVPNFVLLILY